MEPEGSNVMPVTAPVDAVWAETGNSSFLGGRHETEGLTGDLNLTQASHRVDLS